MRREIFTEDHDVFREQVRRFVEREVEPRVPEWNERGMTDREIWRRLGEEGLLGAGDYADAAVQSIYAGSNEIMKVIIARRLGLGG